MIHMGNGLNSFGQCYYRVKQLMGLYEELSGLQQGVHPTEEWDEYEMNVQGFLRQLKRDLLKPKDDYYEDLQVFPTIRSMGYRLVNGKYESVMAISVEGASKHEVFKIKLHRRELFSHFGYDEIPIYFGYHQYLKYYIVHDGWALEELEDQLQVWEPPVDWRRPVIDHGCVYVTGDAIFLINAIVTKDRQNFTLESERIDDLSILQQFSIL